MIDCISVENMRQSDAYTIARLVPSLELMRRAGRHIKRLVCTDIGIALIREEAKICSEREWRELGGSDAAVYHRCPDWLDMTVQKAYGDILQVSF